VSIRSRKVVYEWRHINSGDVVSSIVRGRPYPVLALNPSRARFAVGLGDAIEIITLDVSILPHE